MWEERCLEELEEIEEIEEEESPTQPLSLHRGAHVLVAEDDHELRRIVCEYLTRQGWTVHEAASGSAVLDTFESTYRDAFPAARIDLLVTDVSMPGLSGIEVLRRLRAARWGTPVILVSAFPDRQLVDEAARRGVPLLEKPFSLVDLSHTATGLMLARDPENERGRSLGRS